MLKIIINLLVSLASIAYPLLWLWNDQSNGLFALLCLLIPLWFIKGLYQHSTARYLSWFTGTLLSIIAIRGSVEGMYWYPLVINGILLLLFGSSLWQSQTVVERLARIQEPNLSSAGIRYTRKVTILWCSFFIFNMFVVAVALLLGQYRFWALYSGVISYILLGILMSGEWLVRQRVKRKIINE
ncbi:hypothetical protein HMPREF9952_0569 [Haemophilus pittmaniae HK 85]|jgi:integral membrane protein|uniref:DNA gyrase subunit B n=1 Tax=Haemophilus pittmaniae HK 85 TaxID=1035188 RepID=F9QBR9_9PAST|nr:hypothetical protein [Haemophilus pittmaniae]EGV05009.1 hypothetical protein HMPREF9952_0569 [Haemophilus pittmaniae HK 85]SNV64479.1 Predicted membrane protein [Haemophilus pittmaniae]